MAGLALVALRPLRTGRPGLAGRTVCAGRPGSTVMARIALVTLVALRPLRTVSAVMARSTV
jgi:hypothetical protein